jgi:integrase
VKASGVDFNVRIHDLRHAHASWLLAGGAALHVNIRACSEGAATLRVMPHP